MAAPPKLWEKQMTYNHRQPNFNPDSNSFMQSNPFLTSGSGGGGGVPVPGPPPPLPPRPATYGFSNNGYSRPTFSPYNSYGGLGSYSNNYGLYGNSFGGYNRYGMMGAPSNIEENRFIQLAEESSRPAFESIESIVHAFGSVSMMLESTFHAVHSSFRAVLGVAEHFGRMKSHFAQIFSALAVIRTLRWLYRKLLYLIGLRVQDPSLEVAWQSSAAANPGNQPITEADIKASKSSWPIIMFLAVVFGGPYLIWRLLSSIAPPTIQNKGWMKGQGDHYGAVAVYPFKAGSRGELSMNPGQMLYLAPRQQQPSVRGWLLASNGAAAGLVPASYIKITGHRTSPAPNTKGALSNTSNTAQDQFGRGAPVNRGLNEENMRVMRTAPAPSGQFGTAHLPHTKPNSVPQHNSYSIRTQQPNASHYPVVNHQMPHSIPPNTRQINSNVHQHIPGQSFPAQNPSNYQVTNPQIQTSQQHVNHRVEPANQAQHKPNTIPSHAQRQPFQEYPFNPPSRPLSRESSSSCGTESDDSLEGNRAQNGSSDQCPAHLRNVQATPDNAFTSEQVNRTIAQMTNDPENRIRHEFVQMMHDLNKAAPELKRVIKNSDNLTALSGDPRGARAKVWDGDESAHSPTTSAMPKSTDAELSDFLSQQKDKSEEK